MPELPTSPFSSFLTYSHSNLWRSAGISHPGRVRTLNEDAIFLQAELGVWAVADGMGGHEAGDEASSILMERLLDHSPKRRWSDRVEHVENSILEAHREIQRYALRMGEDRIIGSTIVSVVLAEHYGACLWVGDSRCYHASAKNLQLISRDHSYVNALIDAKRMSEDQAEQHPKRHVLTKAIGVTTPLLLSIELFPIQPTDRIILCSDGFYRDTALHQVTDDLQGMQPEIFIDDICAQHLKGRVSDNFSLIVIERKEHNAQ